MAGQPGRRLIIIIIIIISSCCCCIIKHISCITITITIITTIIVIKYYYCYYCYHCYYCYYTREAAAWLLFGMGGDEFMSSQYRTECCFVCLCTRFCAYMYSICV